MGGCGVGIRLGVLVHVGICLMGRSEAAQRILRGTIKDLLIPR